MNGREKSVGAEKVKSGRTAYHMQLAWELFRMRKMGMGERLGGLRWGANAVRMML